MTRARMSGTFVSRALAAAVLLGCCGAAPLARGDDSLLLPLSDRPPPFIETMEEPSGMRRMDMWTFDYIDKFTNAPEASDVDLVGFFVDGGFPWGSLEVDFVRSDADRERGERIVGGIGWKRHSTGNNLSMRANVSRQFDQEGDDDVDGALMVLGFSRELGQRREILYANAYWAEGDFRRPRRSGPPPFGPVGLSFSGVGLGDYRPALGPRPLDSTGFAVGLQTSFAEQAVNLTVEFGHRQDLDNGHPVLGDTSGTAFTTRFQYKLTDRFLLQMDAYHAMLVNDSTGAQDVESDDDASALRVELRVDF